MQGQSKTLNQRRGRTFPICPEKVASSEGGCTNRGCTCMVPVPQHLLQVCATSISAARAYRWP